MELQFHCQICARNIKASTGLIAHHGYKRPYEGWQTRSCFGARRVPYEIGHDALDEYIVILDDMLIRETEERTKFIAEPPDKLDYTRLETWSKLPKILGTYERPAQFEPFRWADQGFYTPGSYEGQFTRRCGEFKHRIRMILADLKDCRERREAWKLSA